LGTLPEFTRLALAGYPIDNNAWKPLIYIFPVQDIGKVNEEAGKVVSSLQTLIQSPQEIQKMPFLPLMGEVQTMHPHIQYLDFKNGQGLRYLTQYNSGMSPINNSGLFYTYQGLTRDGKYYVSATLPVHHPSLPADSSVTGKEPAEFRSDYTKYVANVAQSLNVQAPNTFAPDLTQLDAMMSSLEIKLTTAAFPTPDGALPFALNTTGIASGSQIEFVPAVSAGDNAPESQVLPAYTRVNLLDYPIANNYIKPQIFIYPVSDLEKINAGAGKVVASLRTLIQSPQEIAIMPFLPLTGDLQMMHTHLQYLDFKNGQGLRYLTEYGNGISPINNAGLFYTYQGLTRDGKYYVAAVLPVYHPSLPADATVTGNEPIEFTNDYAGYRLIVAQALNVQAPNTFAPDLTQLDAMMSSLEIR